MDLERDAWQNKLLAHWNHIRDKEGKRIKVNGIICPVAPTLAAPHDTVR
jgi:amidase